ncbi:MAG: 1-acyl-sn-glycerol-3-phosphate acyltransferase [Bacteroidota bacterium]
MSAPAVPRLLPPEAVLPALPPSVPRRAYPAWVRALGRFTMRVMGWRFVGGFPDRERFVLVGAPHTSNWDGVIGFAAAAVVGVGFNVFAKRQLFVGPLAWLLRLFGGVPVDRDAPGGLVGGAVERLTDGTPRIVAITPEGTRRAVDRWKTGFHRIAVAADVPIAVAALDWGRRQIGIVGTVAPSGDLDADLAAIGTLLEGVNGKHPERQTLPTPASSTEAAAPPRGA